MNRTSLAGCSVRVKLLRVQIIRINKLFAAELDLQVVDDPPYSGGFPCEAQRDPKVPVIEDDAVRRRDAIAYRDAHMLVVKVGIRMQRRRGSLLQGPIGGGITRSLRRNEDAVQLTLPGFFRRGGASVAAEQYLARQ